LKKRFSDLQDAAGPKRHDHVAGPNDREQFIVHFFQRRAKM
jgi:hypothetical protein